MKPIYLKPGQTVKVTVMKDFKYLPTRRIQHVVPHPGGGWIATDGGLDSIKLFNDKGFPAPFLPNEKCYVPETWCLYQTLNMRKTLDGRSFDEISDGLYGYKADGFDTIQDFKDHVRLMSDSSFLDIFIKDDRWQSPAVMPMKASRRHVRIVSCEPMRVSEVTEEDIIKAGLADGSCVWANGAARCNAKGDLVMNQFMDNWHKRHPGREWAWLIRTEG